MQDRLRPLQDDERPAAMVCAVLGTRHPSLRRSSWALRYLGVWTLEAPVQERRKAH